jgi:anti-sigma-K factor RskA
MKCSECAVQLNDFVDDQLSLDDAREVSAHLSGCDHCRRELEGLRALLSATARLPSEIAPRHNLWPDVRREIERSSENRSERTVESISAASILRWVAPLAIAASVALLAPLAERGQAVPNPDRAWTVATLAGVPFIGTKAVAGEASFHVGQWLETDASSRAKVEVPAVGEVTVDSNSRLRLTGTTATEHRLELKRGKLSALIYAPPRIFFVDTPSATAVDLGCAYTLEVDDHGDGELHVTTGYVALEHGGRESIIPSGASCLTRRNAGPGTPFVDDAPDALRQALKRFDFETGAARASVAEIVSLTRPDDTLTLWHLLGRTSDSDRAAVFDRLAEFSAPPAGVTRGGILAGDAAMRRAWGTALGFGTF